MLYGLVENVRSLLNVGAIFRTADGAGVSKLFLTGITGRPPHREIRKVALGAEESVPWEYVQNSEKLAARLKQERIRIVALEATDTSVPYFELDYHFPLCLVVGHEYKGISEPLLNIADHIVHIPMYGTKTSLNVAVAFGVVAYHVVHAKKPEGVLP